MTKMGKDDLGDNYVDQLIQEGVDTTSIKRSETKTTGIACITVDNNGGNTIVIIPGANSELLPNEIENENIQTNLISNSRVLICQNEIPIETTLCALTMAKLSNTISIFNPAPGICIIYVYILYIVYISIYYIYNIIHT